MTGLQIALAVSFAIGLGIGLLGVWIGITVHALDDFLQGKRIPSLTEEPR